jgi:hypothetical protein
MNSFHFLQILALRLLKSVLPEWELTSELSRVQHLVEHLVLLLGNTVLVCCDDPTLSSPGWTK